MVAGIPLRRVPPVSTSRLPQPSQPGSPSVKNANYGLIEVAVGPFELKLGLFEATYIEQAIYTTVRLLLEQYSITKHKKTSKAQLFPVNYINSYSLLIPLKGSLARVTMG